MKILIVFLLSCFFFYSLSARNLNVIRDAETEKLLKDIANELIEETDINPDSLNFYIDNQNYINAFVIPGRKFFFTTRLLLESKQIDDIAGIIAHEIGHITGGHFTEKIKAAEKSSMINILSSILAAGVIATGSTQAGTAILLGGQQLGTSNLLSFSRRQESIADQTAIRLIKSAGFSLEGLLNIFKTLERNENLKQINPYFLTHPLSSERKKYINLNLKNQKIKEFLNLEKSYSLVKAKLNGFFLSEKQLNLIYPKINDLQSAYAFSLMNYKIGKSNLAIELIDKCINEDPENPFFHELKGQILYESGKINLSIPSFRKAIELDPREKSFNLFLAKALYHSNSSKGYNESINLLWTYIKNDEFPVEAWHYLGLNFGKVKKYDFSSYALAEKYLLVNEIKNAKIHIQRVKRISKDKILLNKIADLEKEIRKRERK